MPTKTTGVSDNYCTTSTRFRPLRLARYSAPSAAASSYPGARASSPALMRRVTTPRPMATRSPVRPTEIGPDSSTALRHRSASCPASAMPVSSTSAGDSL